MVQEITLEQLAEKILIDKDNLDIECQEQPLLFSIVVDKYVESLSERDAAKEALSIRMSMLALEYRQQAEHDGERMTEGKLDNRVKSNETYQKAMERYLDAKQQADQWGAIRESFQQRSVMLKELCGLFASGYFALNIPDQKPRQSLRVRKKKTG